MDGEEEQPAARSLGSVAFVARRVGSGFSARPAIVWLTVKPVGVVTVPVVGWLVGELRFALDVLEGGGH